MVREWLKVFVPRGSYYREFGLSLYPYIYFLVYDTGKQLPNKIRKSRMTVNHIIQELGWSQNWDKKVPIEVLDFRCMWQGYPTYCYKIWYFWNETLFSMYTSKNFSVKVNPSHWTLDRKMKKLITYGNLNGKSSGIWKKMVSVNLCVCIWDKKNL